MGGVSGGMGGQGERSGAQQPGAIACHTTESGFIYWTGQRGGNGWCQLQPVPRSWPNGREEFSLVSSTGLAWQRVGLQWRHGSAVRRQLYVTHQRAMETVSSYHSDSALGLPTVVQLSAAAADMGDSKVDQASAAGSPTGAGLHSTSRGCIVHGGRAVRPDSVRCMAV